MNAESILVNGTSRFYAFYARRLHILIALCLAGFAMAAANPAAADTYFMGTDGNLWAINTKFQQYQVHDSNGNALPSYKLKVENQQYQPYSEFYRPVIYGSYVYYIGPNKELMRFNRQTMAPAVHLAQNYVNSCPVVTLGYIYYQGTNNLLYKIDLNGNAAPGFSATNTCNAPPVVYGNRIYINGSGNYLITTDLNGNAVQNTGFGDIQGTPCIFNYTTMTNGKTVTTPYLFFNSHNGLFSCNLGGQQLIKYGSTYIAGSPVAASLATTNAYFTNKVFFLGG